MTIERIAVLDRRGATDDARVVARRWADALIATSHVSFSRAEIEALLLDLTSQLLDLLAAEPFDPSPAGDVGRRLVEADFIGTHTLNQTVRILGTDLRPIADLPPEEQAQVQVMALVGTLTAGYVDAWRERLLDEQEMIKQAVFRAQEVTERRRREAEIKATAAINSSPSGVAITDLVGNIQQVNPAMTAMLGRNADQLIDNPLATLLEPADIPLVLAGFTQVAKGALAMFVSNVNFTGPRGDTVWARLRLSLVQDADHTDESPQSVVATVEDISDLHLLRENQLTQALRDPLTGLPNRTQFMSRLQVTLSNAAPQDRLALCYLDLDGFKIINDGVGSDIGDWVLRRVADILRTEFGEPNAYVARLGGDGFAVLITGTTGSYEISQRFEEVLEQLAEPVFYTDEASVGVLASVGIVERAAGGMTSEELVRSAELTVHRAKASGKAQWLPHDDELDRRDRARFQLAAAIPISCENGDFTVSYEPVVRLADRATVGLRALLRWDHPKLGRLEPAEFLGLAEATGYVARIQRSMLDAVCRQLRRWHNRFDAAAPIVGVPLAHRLAADQDLVRHLRDIIRDTDAPPEKLLLVLPVSAAAAKHPYLLENLDMLKENAFRVAIEDVDPGRTQLSGLGTLAIDGLMVGASTAQSFDPTDSSLEYTLGGLVTLARRHRRHLVVHGVDSVDLADRMAAVGVLFGCGSALGAPGTAEQIERTFPTG